MFWKSPASCLALFVSRYGAQGLQNPRDREHAYPGQTSSRTQPVRKSALESGADRTHARSSALVPCRLPCSDPVGEKACKSRNLAAGRLREQRLCRIQDPAAGIRFPATRGQPAPLCKGQPSLFVRAAKPGRHNVSRRSLPSGIFRQCTGLGALRPQCENSRGGPGGRGGAVNGVRQENSQPRRSEHPWRLLTPPAILSTSVCH